MSTDVNLVFAFLIISFYIHISHFQSNFIVGLIKKVQTKIFIYLLYLIVNSTLIAKLVTYKVVSEGRCG